MKTCKLVVTVSMLALLLFFSTSRATAARPGPPFSGLDNVQAARGHEVSEAQEKSDEVENESCEGLAEEECLMRRTLAAHTDYIYTQKQTP